MTFEFAKLLSVENINHPDDFYFYFQGGHVVWNASHDPSFRFWYNGELVVISTRHDARNFMSVVRTVNMMEDDTLRIANCERFPN
jgi:hypothetical protein